MQILHKLVYTGIGFARNASERRSIYLCNLLSVILFLLGILLFTLYYLWYDWSVITATIPAIAVLCLSSILLNYFNLSALSRTWLCLVIPVTTMALSIYSKNIYFYRQEELDYFSFRFIILSSSVFPSIFFSIREKRFLFGVSILNYLILILFDPLHQAFNVPYSKHDMLKESNYYFINVVVTITYAIMVGAVLFLKRISEENEIKTEALINDLHKINNELLSKNKEIEIQNQEITAQTENLNASQTKLQEAYQLIEQQKERLLKTNNDLSSELVTINNNLTKTNNELIKHNNELRQFSYTVSHNLRGPVASLGGLINLISKENLSKENTEIFSHINSSVQRLDSIIKDLSNIIDIRHDLFNIRQKIDLDKEVSEIIEIHKKEINQLGISIKTNFSQCTEIFSVKPMLHSILYNLITNAIKYRSHERPPEINISCHYNENHFIIHVKDNGLGIDLKSHKDNLFRLYKRFHYHTEGRGLGLYLVKLQTEILGGHIEVESEVNRFTKFTVYLAKPINIDRQILHESKYASIFYDATLDSTGVIWNGPVPGNEYRNIFAKCVEFFKVYSTPNYITDLRNQGHVGKEDQQWAFETMIPEAARYGIKKVAAIGISDAYADENIKDYYLGIHNNLLKFGVEFRFFPSVEEASLWMVKSKS